MTYREQLGHPMHWRIGGFHCKYTNITHIKTVKASDIECYNLRYNLISVIKLVSKLLSIDTDFEV